MRYLPDTGVLLRIFDRDDPQRPAIRKALSNLRRQGHSLMISPQNVAEFWAVSTRPSTARGGLGLSLTETDKRIRVLEKICSILPDQAHTYSIWRDLVRAHSVSGVKVHDARLVAWMITHSISDVVTLNVSDFSRYPAIKAHLPSSLT